MKLLAAAALALAGATNEPTVTLDASAPFVDVLLAGSPVRLRVDFAAHQGVVLNPAAAQRLGLQRTGRIVMNIGPLKVSGELTYRPLIFAGSRTDTRIAWYPRQAVADADGLIGPASLPVSVVRMSLRPQFPAERRWSLAASTRGDFGIHVPLRAGQQVIAVEFSPHVPSTRAPAATAAVLASAFSGQLTGPVTAVDLALGVSRPARRMQLARPLRIASLSISDLLVRVGDFRGSYDLPPDADAPEDEVRVVARDGQQPRFVLRVGADHLSACSEIAYRALTSAIELTCSEP